MNILSLCCKTINQKLEDEGQRIDIINLNSLIQDIYYPQSIEAEVNDKYLNNNILDIKNNSDIVLVDLITILKKHVKYKNKILLEEALLPTLDKRHISNISKESMLQIAIESIDIVLNEMISKYHISKIILVKTRISNKYKLIDDKMINLDEEDIKYIENINEMFIKIEDEIVEKNPGISFTENINLCLDNLNQVTIENNEDIHNIINDCVNNITIFEKEKIHKSICNIRYYFEDAKIFNKDKLIVIFSAFSKDKPKYNYIKSLIGIDCNKLYILDDYGEKGCYYLGLNGNFDVETSVMSLISKIMSKKNVKFTDVIAVGSSKGGSAALYYGIKYNFKEVIAGAPQYKIGTYLSDLSIKTYGKDIFGEINEANRIKYDNLIRKVLNDDTNTKISILTSDGDNQYKKVLKDIEYIMDEKNIKFKLDKCDIGHHNEISNNFPEYMYKKIVESLGQKGTINNIEAINKLTKLIKKVRSK